MRLEITAVAATSTIPFPPTELSIALPDSLAGPDEAAEESPAAAGRGSEASGAESSGMTVARVVAEKWPGCSFTVAGFPLEGLHVGREPLTDGAVVLVHSGAATATNPLRSVPPDSSAAPERRHEPSAPALLAVRSGPGAGAMYPLHRGTYRLGRGRCEITIADPTLSRHHGTLTVGESAMTLSAEKGSAGFDVLRQWLQTPAASTTPLKGVMAIEAGDVIRCGMSSFAILLSTPANDGGLGVGMPPGLLDAAVLEPLPLSVSSGPQRGRRAMLAAGLLPLVVGVLFAWLTGSWMFLAFAAMGAVTVLVPLLGGSRRRRALAAAVAAGVARDAARRAATFPGADVLLSAAHSPAGPIGTSPCGSASDGVHPPAGPPGATFAVRLGMADQAAHLAPVPADDGGFTAPLVRGLPVALPVDVGSTTISGTAGSVRLLLNFVLMQLDAAGVPVVLQGQVPGLPLCARFLPRTVLAATDSDAVAAIGASSPPVTGPLSRGVFTPDGAPAESPATATPCVLVTVNSPPAGARSAFPGVRCLHFSTFGQEAVPADSTAAVVLRPRGDGISGVTGTVEFVPDGVQDLLFDRYCRARARHISGQRALPHFAPSTVPLPEGATPAAVARRWSSTANGPLAPVPIGSSDTGAELFDFSHDGPHLLVGGTTGSGKSEFLRTLVGSLAAAHSPADLQFVLIDFKGGAGLGPLHRFPHTTSLVTDLGGHSMARTLASLRAEIHRRERALGHAGASDCDQYRAGFAGSALTERAGMAHLVVVVDEFRVLVDQFPDAMAELMQIAAVGRSLGIHLVMATQRPQGAINADIRANVTSAVCLRVQTTFDSQDVIGSGVAAAIGVDLPGRAFISRAGARPTQFQSATLCLPGREDGEHPRADLVADLLSHTSVGKVLHPQGPAHRAVRVPGSGTDRLGEFGERTNSSVAAVAGLLASAWRDVAGTAARAVVAPELPPFLDVSGPGRNSSSDQPTAGAVAGSAPARSVVLGLIDVPERQSLETLAWNPERHSHIGCVGPRTGASAAVALIAGQLTAANDRNTGQPCFLYLLDGDGTLEPLSSSPWVGGHVTPQKPRTAARLLVRLQEDDGAREAAIAVLVSDWGQWVSALRASPWPWAEDLMASLVRTSRPRLTVVLGGDRELLTAPFMPAIPNRIFLPCGASAESRLVWPRIPEIPAVPGRAALFGPMNSAASGGPADTPHIAQLGTTCAGAAHAGSNCVTPPPLTVLDLPDVLSLAQVRTAIRQVGSTVAEPRTIVLGLGGDGSDPIHLTVQPGTVVPILGGPGAGKSTFLRAVQLLNAATDEAGAKMLCVDDAMSLDHGESLRISQALSAGAVVLAAIPNHLPSLSRLPLEWGLRGAEQGVVIRPHRAHDGEFFGIRLDTAGSEPAGRAVLINQGRCEWFQFPNDDGDDT